MSMIDFDTLAHTGWCSLPMTSQSRWNSMDAILHGVYRTHVRSPSFAWSVLRVRRGLAVLTMRPLSVTIFQCTFTIQTGVTTPPPPPKPPAGVGVRGSFPRHPPFAPSALAGHGAGLLQWWAQEQTFHSHPQDCSPPPPPSPGADPKRQVTPGTCYWAPVRPHGKLPAFMNPPPPALHTPGNQPRGPEVHAIIRSWKCVTDCWPSIP